MSNHKNQEIDEDDSSSMASTNEAPEEEEKTQRLLLSQEGGRTARGKKRRRRGRTTTSSSSTVAISGHPVSPPVTQEDTLHNNRLPTTSRKTVVDHDHDDNHKPTNQQRYCIGRKPLTDFKVGQTYTGTVVYTKPFGMFVDINCHKDAFCHISRISDEYMDANVLEQLYPVGKTVSLRIIEIDRQRLTGSMQQSQSKIQQEQESIQKRQERQRLRNSKKRKQSRDDSAVSSSDQHPNKSQELFSTVPTKLLPHRVEKKSRIHARPATENNINKKKDQVTSHKEDKRARKLARRALRREQQQEVS